MTNLKIIFVLLLCIPLLLLVMHFFGKLVDEVARSRKQPDSTQAEQTPARTHRKRRHGRRRTY